MDCSVGTACRKRPEKMPISSTSAFSDPGDFRFALRRCGLVRLIPLLNVGFRARLTDIRLSQVELLAASERVSRIATVSAPADQMLIVFPKTREGAHYWAGQQLVLGELIVMFGPACSTWRIRAPTVWGAILLPLPMLAGSLPAIADERAHMPPPGLTRWRPPGTAFGDLLKLHRAAVSYTIRQPEAPVETEAARGLEQQLLTAVVESLSTTSARRD